MSLLLDPRVLARDEAAADLDYYQVGQAHILLIKAAGDAVAAPVLHGRLIVTPANWGMITVPNNLIRGLFDAIDEPGVELPLRDGKLRGHISVFRPEEIDKIGGPDKISERGHPFSYQLGPIMVVDPKGWPEMSRAWYIKIIAPELKALRRSYGLTPLMNGDHEFHATIAVRRKNVLSSGSTSKAAGASDDQARVSREGEDPGVQHLAGDDRALREPEAHPVQGLRGERAQGLPKVAAELPGVPGGYGGATTGHDDRTPKKLAGLHALELLLGNTQAAGEKQAEQPTDHGQWGHADAGRVVGADGYQLRHDPHQDRQGWSIAGGSTGRGGSAQEDDALDRAQRRAAAIDGLGKAARDDAGRSDESDQALGGDAGDDGAEETPLKADDGKKIKIPVSIQRIAITRISFGKPDGDDPLAGFMDMLRDRAEARDKSAAADWGLSDILSQWHPSQIDPYKDMQGFAATFQPQLPSSAAVESLGRLAMIAAPAAALTGGLALWRPWERPAVPPKGVRRPKSVEKVAAISDVLNSVYSQLPRMRIPDTVVGAGLGALGGVGYDWLHGGNTSWRKRLGRVLTGAGAGAALGNIAGDRARRYIANSLMPYDYAGSPTKALVPKSFSHVWNAAVLDKPQQAVADPEGYRSLVDWNAGTGTPEAAAYRRNTLENYMLPSRVELLRRQLGVHTDNPTTDWWKAGPSHQVSLNPQNPQAVSAAQRFMGDVSRPDPRIVDEMFGTAPGEFLDRVSGAGRGDIFGAALMGGQQIPHRALPGGGVDASVLDRWDYTLDPKEQAWFEQNTLNALSPAWRAQKFAPATPLSTRDKIYSSNANAWGTLAGRWGLDNLVAYRHPWVTQRFRTTPLPAQPGAPPPDQQIQMLTPEGAPLGDPITRASHWKFMKGGSADYAPGLPSRTNLGPFDRLSPGQLLSYVVQQHDAERAGRHYDIRFGNPEMGLLSWAARKGVPEPMGKHLAVQQPVHRYGYKDFEGEIPEGYGKGTVKTHTKGQILITKATPESIHFTTAHGRHPERFTLARPKGWGGKNWLLMNTTPRDPAGYEKLHYKSIPAEQVEPALKAMQESDTLEAKVDGASQLIRLAKGHAEALSYRTSKTTGGPIVHSERLFGGRPEVKVPPHLEGSVLKGELYAARHPGEAAAGTAGATPGKPGVPPLAGRGRGAVASTATRGDQATPRLAGTAQDVGTLLNSSVARSLQLQKERGQQLRTMLYDIQRYGKTDITLDTPRNERRRMLEEIAAHLPADKFHISEEARGPEAATKLWNTIRSGQHPLTQEGSIFWPRQGPPVKAKIRPEHDVVLTGTFPGTGKRQATIGGFTYSHPDEPGKTVGRVGTGFDESFLSEVAKDPAAYFGRVARLQAHAKLPSGALREPSFIALHEDKNAAAVAGLAGLCLPGGDAEKQAGSHPVLDQLLSAKTESDRGNYRAKHQILMKLIHERPGEFVRDSAGRDMVGLTHVPTGFKLHAPAVMVGGRVAPYKQQKEASHARDLSPSAVGTAAARDGAGAPTAHDVGPPRDPASPRRADQPDRRGALPEMWKQAIVDGAHDRPDRDRQPGDLVGVLQPARFPLLSQGLWSDPVLGCDPATKSAASTSTVSRGGRTYDIDALIARTKTRPVERVPLGDVEKPNRSSNMGYSQKRYAAVDMNKPILVGTDGTLWDGRHRLSRHLDEGKSHIKAVRVTRQDLDAVVHDGKAGPKGDPIDRSRIGLLPAKAAALQKLADLLPWVQLQPQQKRVAKRVAGGENLLVYHGLGTGKSLASLAAAESVGGPYTAVVPASLRPNYQKEIAKFTDQKDPAEVMSYTGVGMGKEPRVTPSTVIMDEVQRIRNPASAGSRAAMDLAMRAPHKVLLSGTPIVNAPSDLAVPLSILSGKEMSPAAFNKQFVGSETVHPGLMGWLRGIKPAQRPALQNEDDLERLLEGHVDYQAARTPEGVKTNDERVEVDLSPQQQDFYKLMWGKLPWMTRWKLSNDYPLSSQELSHLSAFMTGPRQAALSLYPYHASKDPMQAFQTSAKLQAAMGSLKQTLGQSPQAKALVYSNFVDAGLTPYGAALEREGIPYGQFHGNMTDEERKRALDDYNAGRSRVLLLGPAAAEGISAKGTQLIQLLDPHWNEARMGQARGRGLRFDSHEGLPEELRNVRIQRFVARMPEPGFFGRLFGGERRPSADEILEQESRRKEHLNEQFRDILRRVGSPGYRHPWHLFG